MITIIGSGAIGASLGSAIAETGRDVEFIDTDAAHVAAINAGGLRVISDDRERRITAHAFTPESYRGEIRTAILAVKAQHTASAIEGLRDRLAPDALVLVAQNGLGAFEVAEMIGEERVLGALVNIAADCTAPGEVTFYGFGSLVVGSTGARVEREGEMLEMLGNVGRIETTDDLRGLLWNKLAFGAVLSATALDHTPQLDTILAHPRLVHGLLAEVFAVADAAGIEVPDHDHLDPRAFAAGASPSAVSSAISDWVDYQRPHQKPHSGIYRDLAVRKRKTEVSAHFADIVKTGSAHAVPLPLITRLSRMIAEAETGERELGPRNIAELEGLAR